MGIFPIYRSRMGKTNRHAARHRLSEIFFYDEINHVKVFEYFIGAY